MGQEDKLKKHLELVLIKLLFYCFHICEVDGLVICTRGPSQIQLEVIGGSRFLLYNLATLPCMCQNVATSLRRDSRSATRCKVLEFRTIAY
jgi:hypothetical protein